jgi:hypothetical protein
MRNEEREMEDAMTAWSASALLGVQVPVFEASEPGQNHVK